MCSKANAQRTSFGRWLIAGMVMVESAVDGGWFGWKVLRGFQPDGAVLELYTGLALKTRRQPAFAPETNLTLASSILAEAVAYSRTTSLPPSTRFSLSLSFVADFHPPLNRLVRARQCRRVDPIYLVKELNTCLNFDFHRSNGKCVEEGGRWFEYFDTGYTD